MSILEPSFDYYGIFEKSKLALEVSKGFQDGVGWTQDGFERG